MANEAGLSVPEALVRALARGQREAACLRSVGPLGRQADAKFAVQRALCGHEQELKRQYDRLNAQQWQDGREVAATPALLAARRLIAGQQEVLGAELHALREGLLAHLHTLATYSDVNAARGRELQAEGKGEQAWERGALALVERKLAERLQLLLAQGPAAVLSPLAQELEALNLQRYLPAPAQPAAHRPASAPASDQAPAQLGAKRARTASPPERLVRQRVGGEARPVARATDEPDAARGASPPGPGQPGSERLAQQPGSRHLSAAAPRHEHADAAGGEGAELLEVVPDSGAGSSLPGGGNGGGGDPVPASQLQSTPSALGSPGAVLSSPDWPPPAPKTQTQRFGEGQPVSQLDSTSPNGRPAAGGRTQPQLRPQEQQSQVLAQPGGLDPRRLLLASQGLTPADGSQPSQRPSPQPPAQPQALPVSCARQPDLAAAAAPPAEAWPWPRDPRPRDRPAALQEPSPASQGADAQQAYQATQSPPDGSPLACAAGPNTQALVAAEAGAAQCGSPGDWSGGSHAPAQPQGRAAAGSSELAGVLRSGGHRAQAPSLLPLSPDVPAASQRPGPRLQPATQAVAGYGSLFFHRAMPTPSQRGASLLPGCWWPGGSQEHELNPWEALGSASAPAEAGGAGSQRGLEGSFLRAAGVHSQ